MTEILTTSNLTYMSSQSGSIQDLAAYSDHLPSSILGSEAEPDSSSRQDYPPSQPSSDMGVGLRYMTLAQDDVRFSPESGTSNSPVCSIEQPAVQNYSSSSSLSSFSPYTPLYHHNLGAPTYPSAANNYYSPNSFLSMPDNKPRLSSLNSPGLASFSRSQGLPHPGSPITTRDLYHSGTPHLRRASDLPRSPLLSGTSRGGPLSPSSSSGFTSPTNMDGSQSSAGPPLHPTEVFYSLQSTDGQQLKPEIYARIDKGFFMADNDWTCYRRNYFSLNCWYTILPTIPTGSVHLVSSHGGAAAGAQVQAFAMSIAAVVDGRDGKPIELVQHTPKRDKGPQQKPDRVTLHPKSPPQHGGLYGGESLSGRSYESQGYNNANPSAPATEAVFERIQFKNATANNGKRRAAQQYYHLLVELFADVGNQHPDRWVKIAARMSAQMVVRGRSPGHYQTERRGSNASSGPGGGAGGAGSYTPNTSSRTPGDLGMSSSNSMLSGSGYGNNYDTRSHHYRSHVAPLQIPMEPTMSAEEAKGIVDPPNFLYFPHSIYEGTNHHNEQRYHLPSVSEYTTSKMKHEYPNSHVLPALTFSPCGRWEGVSESKGFFPSAQMQHELNIS